MAAISSVDKAPAGKSRRPNPREYLHALHLVIMFCVLWALCCHLLPSWARSIPSYSETTTGWRPPLAFTENGTFQIAIFEDLHFGENAWEAWGPRNDKKSVKVMNRVLDVESPQLVVLNGDLITGENTFLENSTSYVSQIVGPMLQRNLPWASTYGNHDSAFNLSREDILGHERLHLNSLTNQMVFGRNSGVSNYFLPVYPRKDATVPCLILWFFDSRGGFLYQQLNATGDKIGQADWVDQSVVDWFRATSESLTQLHQKIIPSLAFVHIPVNASRTFQNEVGVDPHRQPGIDDDKPLAPQAAGWCVDGSNGEDCEYGEQDVPFMKAVTSTPGLMALFSGHDHGDTWCYRWEKKLPGMAFEGNGLNLCFGQHSGHGGYGNWTRGARQILVTEAMLQDHAVDTWIRLETGYRVGSVQLNKTYNEDFYPATPNTHTS